MDITEKTRVPLFAIVIAVPTFVFFVFWISVMFLTAAEAKRVNEIQDQKLDAQTSLILDIRDRVIRIEEKVKK